jgi:hypothetical protein
VPTSTLVSLHELLPEIRIVGISDSRARAAYYKSIGIAAPVAAECDRQGRQHDDQDALRGTR